MRARLIGHKERLTIRPIDRAGTHVDPETREPYANLARGASLELVAQLEEGDRNVRQAGQAGANVRVQAVATFLTREVKAAGWTPADGDQVVQVANCDGSDARAVAWYVTGPRYTGKTRWGNELVVVGLTDRNPGRRASEGL